MQRFVVLFFAETFLTSGQVLMTSGPFVLCFFWAIASPLEE